MNMRAAGKIAVLDAGNEPPHNIQLEQSLLGAVLINNDSWHRCDAVEPRHFFEPIHQRVYEICSNLIREGKTASPITVRPFLPADCEVAGLKVEVYLARLCREATTIINAPDYAKNIRSFSDRRDLLKVSDDLRLRAVEPDELVSIHNIIEEAEEKLFDIAQLEGDKNGFLPFSHAVRSSIDLASKAYQRDGHLSGLATGLLDLDNLMGGLQKSDLIIIAGRPGMGKTALATGIAYHAANDKSVVGFFSLEMSAEQLATRVISERVEVPSSRIRRGELREGEFDKFANKGNEIANIPLFIEQTGGLSIAQLCSRARRLKRLRGMDLMIVDYIQLLNGGKRFSSNRTEEVTQITAGLKALAKELNIPIIALAQLNRNVESREDKRPMLSDLRESGSIEQDADVVMFVYRDEYYLAKAEPKEAGDAWFEWETKLKAAEGKADIIVDKQRHGPTGTVQVQFQAQFTRFGNLAREDRLPERGVVVPFNERGYEK